MCKGKPIFFKALFLMLVVLAASSGKAKAELLFEDSLSVRERFALRTNVVDWVVMLPNFAVDYDIVNTPYEKISVGMGVKYNWNSRHNYVPNNVYNIFDVRTDLRYYWRQQPYIEENGHRWQKDWVESRTKWWDRWFTRLRLFRTVENPREWISYYVGPYLSYTSYSLKLGEIGRQGNAFGFGATGGIALPLYGYPNGNALDLELGASVGWHVAGHVFYTADVEGNCYAYAGSRPAYFVYFPLITDLRLGLVYRFTSIQYQHTEVDEILHARHKNMYERDLFHNEIDAYNLKVAAQKREIDQLNSKIRDERKRMVGVDSLWQLELLQPIVLQMRIPQKFIKNESDTIARDVVVNAIDDIVDPIIKQMRKEIDTIPGISRATIDQTFVNRYKFISEAANVTSINRATVIKSIYEGLNEEIRNTNKQLSESSLPVTDSYSERILRYDHSPEYEDVNYNIAVSRSTLSKNDRIIWENHFKRLSLEEQQARSAKAAAQQAAAEAAAETPEVVAAPDSTETSEQTENSENLEPSENTESSENQETTESSESSSETTETTEAESTTTNSEQSHEQE